VKYAYPKYFCLIKTTAEIANSLPIIEQAYIKHQRNSSGETAEVADDDGAYNKRDDVLCGFLFIKTKFESLKMRRPYWKKSGISEENPSNAII
jgi:hypothetical protein